MAILFKTVKMSNKHASWNQMALMERGTRSVNSANL